MVTLDDWLAATTIIVGGAVVLFAAYLAYRFQLKSARADKRRSVGSELIGEAWLLQAIATNLASIASTEKRIDAWPPTPEKDHLTQAFAEISATRTYFGLTFTGPTLLAKYRSGTLTKEDVEALLLDTLSRLSERLTAVSDQVRRAAAQLTVLGADEKTRRLVGGYLETVLPDGAVGGEASPSKTGEILREKLGELENHLREALD